MSKFFSNQQSSSSDEEQKRLEQFQKSESYLPQFGQIDLNQQTLQFDGIKISLTKLKKKLTMPLIKQFYQTLKKIKTYTRLGNSSIFDYIPYEVLSTIQQFTGKQYRLQYICLGTNVPYHKRIIKSPLEISHIDFPNLQILKINNLMIDNIESLAWIQASNLRCLQLYGNKITKINCLTKSHLPKLQIVTFYHNPITEIERFCRIHSKKLTGYEFDNKETYNHRVEDYRFLFKMQNPQLKMLKVQDQKRIDLRDKPAFKILNQPRVKILYNEPQVINRRRYSYSDYDDDVLD